MPYHLAQCYICKIPRENSSKSASAPLSKPRGFLTVQVHLATNTVWWLDISFADISFAASPAMCGNYDALNLNNCETILLPKKRRGFLKTNGDTATSKTMLKLGNLGSNMPQEVQKLRIQRLFLQCWKQNNESQMSWISE